MVSQILSLVVLSTDTACAYYNGAVVSCYEVVLIAIYTNSGCPCYKRVSVCE